MIYRFALLLAIVGSAAIVAPDFADAYGLVKIIPAIVGLFFLWTLALIARFKKTAIDAPLAACAAAFILSLSFSIDPRVGLSGIYSQPFGGATALIPALLIFYAVNASREEWPEGALWAAALVALIEGVVCALQLAGKIEHPFDMIGRRALGTMGSPVFLAAILAPCLPVACWAAWRGRTLGWAAAIGGFLAVAASGSRGSWLAALAGLWGFLAASGRLRPRLAHVLAAAAILGALAASSGAMGKLRSDQGRSGVWAVAMRAGAERPIFGWGPDTFSLVMRQSGSRTNEGLLQACAHNDLLQALATTGIIGLSAYSWLWAVLLLALWREARGDNDPVIDSLMAGIGLTRGTDFISHEQERAAAVFGGLLALCVAAKFNPIPPSAIYIAAALAANALPLGDVRKNSILGWALGFALWMAAAMIAGIGIAAEGIHSEGVARVVAGDVVGGATLLRRANEIDPQESSYAARRCELIYRLAPKKEFALRALRSSAAIINSHPQDSAGYELMATAELWASMPRAAIASARMAHLLNPRSAFAIERWRSAAVLVGDVREQRAAESAFDSTRN